MKHSYVIIDESQESISEIGAIAARFQDLLLVGTATDYDAALDLILETRPSIIFLEIDPQNSESKLSLGLINELHRYLTVIPKVIVVTGNSALAFEAVKYNVYDFVVKPLSSGSLTKCVLRFQKEFPIVENRIQTEIETAPLIETPIILSPIAEHPNENEKENDNDITINGAEASLKIDVVGMQNKPLIICVKSYGDYRFIDSNDICYLQADNNSTDLHLNNGEMITAFKTLKHFENVLNLPFVRIHNSYIVNIDYVSRIHTGNSVCYIKNTTTKLPFSKSYKDNVDSIINSITKGNYLEI